MTEPTKGHSRFNPGEHEHMRSGVAIMTTRQAVHVFRLRSGRSFTRASIYRHRQALKSWVWRYWGRRADAHTSIPDVDSVRILHMKEDADGGESLNVTYTLWDDVPAHARCLAAQFAMGANDDVPDMDVVVAALLAQHAGTQYEEGPSGGLPN